MGDLRADERTISWLRYIWIAGAVALGVALVGYGLLVTAASGACESDCGASWPWVAGSLALGGVTIVAAITDAVRTFRHNRHARS